MTVTLTFKGGQTLSPPQTRKPASSQCSDITQVTSPAGLQADSAFTSSSREEEHKHLIKNPSEQHQAEKGQWSDLPWLAKGKKIINN